MFTRTEHEEQSDRNTSARKNTRRQTKVLLEAGFEPEDFSLPSVPEIDLGNDIMRAPHESVTIFIWSESNREHYSLSAFFAFWHCKNDRLLGVGR